MIGYLASMAGGLNEFTLNLNELSAKLKPTTESFARVNGNDTRCFITPQVNSGNITVNSFPCYIGARQFEIGTYPTRPFYVLDINENKIRTRLNKDNDLTPEMLQRRLKDYREELLNKVPFRFEIEREDYRENKEKLVITGVTGNDGDELKPEDFQLQVQSINDPQCYWLDSGEFDLNIATTDFNVNK